MQKSGLNRSWGEMKDSCESISYLTCCCCNTCYSKTKLFTQHSWKSENWSTRDVSRNSISKSFLKWFQILIFSVKLYVASTLSRLGRYSGVAETGSLPGKADADSQLVRDPRQQTGSFQQNCWFAGRAEKHMLGGNNVIWFCFFTNEWKLCLINFYCYSNLYSI